MRRPDLLLCSALWGCAPAVSDSSSAQSKVGEIGVSEAAETTNPDPDAQPDADDGEDTAGDGEDTAGDGAEDGPDPDEDDGPDDTPDDDETSGPIVQSGVWVYVNDDFDIVEDPCNWADFLEPAGGLIDFMPTDFTVEGDLEAFSMLAGRYGGSFGAETPVTCELLGRERFQCETQDVIPVDGLLGSYGWRYTVDFEGTVATSRRINGTAVVAFQSIDAESQAALDALGIDFRSCTQVLDLQLGYSPRESE